MKNNNEILTILEDEFVRLINMYNNKFNGGMYLARIDELIILCEKFRIPFDWDWGEESVKSITISGKRIEFQTFTHFRKVMEGQNEESVY